MADLGDLSGFLREGALANLDWLDVDEKDYRALEHLPKQNLDFAPDLEAAWSHEDRPASAFVPNTGDAPRTMLEVGESGNARSLTASALRASIEKVARFALMQSDSLRKFKEALFSRFDRESLTEHRDILAAALEERGLLGKYYISAHDFPGCDLGKKQAAQFVRRYAAGAEYLLVKEGCAGCAKAQAQEGRCGVFQKKIVLELPYTEAEARRVEGKQASRGKEVQALVGTPKERIRAAMLARGVESTPLQAVKPIEDPSRYLQAAEAPKKVHLPVLAKARQELARQELEVSAATFAEGKVASSVSKVAFEKLALDVTELLRREMLRGKGESDLIQALKLSFTTEQLKETRSRWEPLFREAGYYGTIYTTQESFDDCRKGADFLATHNPQVKAVVASSKCSGCIFNKVNRCMMYGKPLVASAEDTLTSETVKNVIWEHKLAGRLETGAEKVEWGESPKAALKAIYRVASTKPETVPSSLKARVETGFYGSSQSHVTAGLVKRDIVKTAQQYLNEGLYGKDLIAALRRKFDPRDILAAKEDLRPVVAEQGLQGIYYVDPTVYSDYGKGCDEASRLHRARLVEYVKVGSSCASCVHQTRAGHCSKINKKLAHEPPYVDKVAQQKAILASGGSLERNLGQLVISGSESSVLSEYEMQAEMAVDVDPLKGVSASVDIEFGTGKVKL